jgi:DNA-binding GntR family transcriptional regulator
MAGAGLELAFSRAAGDRVVRCRAAGEANAAPVLADDRGDCIHLVIRRKKENSALPRAHPAPRRRSAVRLPAPAPTAAALPLVRSRNLAEQVADIIVDGIASGALVPGQRLVETELAQRLQVSRVPLRESLKMLEAQGILESSPHRGAHVAEFDEVKIDHICEARVALEKMALRDAIPAYRADPKLIHRLDGILATMQRAADALDWTAISKADLAFHREICAASGNDVVSTLWETLARHVLIVFGREIRGERDAANLGPQHRRVRDMLLTAGLPALEAEIERHIMRLRNRRRSAQRLRVQPRA